jgi:hypothetical protein
MNTILLAVIEAAVLLFVYVLGELFSHHVLFRLLNQRFLNRKNNQSDPAGTEVEFESKAQLKGHFERGMLALGLAAGFPQILIAFGALKVGTFFKDGNESKISSDYYLIGNVVSISIAIVYAVIWRVTMDAIKDCF